MLRNCDYQIFAAIERNDADAVQKALQDGANVNAVSHYPGQRGSISPLTRASDRGNDQIVRILLDAGADAKWEELAGMTAASIACRNGHFAVVQMLIHHDRTLLECCKWPPMFWACMKGHLEIFRFLMDQGCNVHAIFGSSSQALMVAATNGRHRCPRL
jgi:uncharacterized protein